MCCGSRNEPQLFSFRVYGFVRINTMNRTAGLITLVAGIICFIAGFVFANFLNRSALLDLAAENERLKSEQTQNTKAEQDITLSDDEISAKLAEAEQNPSNFAFQKSLGLGLYRYGAAKKDKSIIEKALPPLERAHSLDTKDYEVVVGLGHAHYDIGYFGKDNSGFQKAREFYNKALAIRPNDIEVRADLGLTYFLQDPPDFATAVTEFERSLAVNPKHEKTLSFAALAMKNQGKDASKYLEVLRSVNPNNPTFKELTAQRPASGTNLQ